MCLCELDSWNWEESSTIWDKTRFHQYPKWSLSGSIMPRSTTNRQNRSIMHHRRPPMWRRGPKSRLDHLPQFYPFYVGWIRLEAAQPNRGWPGSVSSLATAGSGGLLINPPCLPIPVVVIVKGDRDASFLFLIFCKWYFSKNLNEVIRDISIEIENKKYIYLFSFKRKVVHSIRENSCEIH